MIDTTKLTRDYSKEPLKKVKNRYEPIPREDIEELYINQDLTKEQLAEYLGVSRETVKNLLKKYKLGKYDYNDKKSKHLNRDEVYQYYIVENHSMKEALTYFNISDACFVRYCRKYNIKKDTKQIYENYKKTNLERYGVENQFQLDSIKQKSQETTLQKYGKEHFVQTEEYKEKNQETRTNRYGEDDPYQREKFKDTCIEKYGVPNPDYAGFTTEQMKLITDKEYLISYIKEHNIKNASELATIAKLSPSTTNRITNDYDIRHLFDYTGSQYERLLCQIVEQIGLEYIPNYRIPTSKKEIDIYIPSKHLGIEFNGDYWHCELSRPANYHQDKSKLAEEQGIFIYHIFEHQWKEKSYLITREIAELLGVKKIYEGNYMVKSLPYEDAKKFIEENSLYVPYYITKSLGLYIDNKLIHIQSYLDMGGNYWSILFDVNLLNEDYKNASMILLEHFMKDTNCDKLQIQTNVGYKNQNFPLQLGYKTYGYIEPDYKWLKSGIVEDFSDWDIEERHKNGWLKLFDCGQKYFMKK